jgi:TRAP-type C4-dicarboxylate transport system permease small subunit
MHRIARVWLVFFRVAAGAHAHAHIYLRVFIPLVQKFEPAGRDVSKEKMMKPFMYLHKD